MKEVFYRFVGVGVAAGASAGMSLALSEGLAPEQPVETMRLIYTHSVVTAYLVTRCVQDGRADQLLRVVSWSCFVAFLWRLALGFHWVGEPFSLWPVCIAPFFVATSISVASVSVLIETDKPLVIPCVSTILSVVVCTSLDQPPVHVVIDALSFFMADYFPVAFFLRTLETQVFNRIAAARTTSSSASMHLPDMQEDDAEDEVEHAFRED